MRKKLLTGILIAAVCIVMPSTVTKAASVSATGDKETAIVGDSYTVSVNIDGADGAAIAPEVSVNYDVNRLQFVSCSGEYGGGGGGLVSINSPSAEVAFTILSGGQANVDVTAVFDGDGASAQTVTTTVMVEGEDTAASMSGMTENMGTGVEAGSVATSDGKLVSAVFADEIMPVGFHKTTTTFEEQMVEAAQFDMGNIMLLYVTDMDGNNGNFDIFDQSTGELSDFLQISGIENRFIIALKAGAEVTPPKDFAKAELQWNAQNLEAYSYVGEQGDSAVNANEFFLLYAVSSEGNTGWYMYDQIEGTYQRYVEGLHGGAAPSGDGLISQITSPASTDEGGINVMLIVLIALAVVLIALIVTVIIMGVKLHEFNSYDYIDEDEEDYGDSENSYLERLAAGQQEADLRAKPVMQAEEQAKSESKPKPEDKPKKTSNIYEQYRQEDEAAENDESDIPEEFIVRKKSAKVSKEELAEQMAYERDGYADDESYIGEDDELIDDDDDLFSPRGRGRDGERLSRAEKKALKAEEKARKKAEKRMKKEYGEYGPVDWDSWQNGVEGGERTAAAHMHRRDVDDEQPVRRAPQPEEPQVRRTPAPQQMEEQPIRRAPAPQGEPGGRQDGTRQPKGNPMDMMRGIPANDNNEPVQAKPVQQFDFDEDFEFEFLDIDDDD